MRAAILAPLVLASSIGIASAECRDDLTGLRTAFSDHERNRAVGSEIRKLRTAAITLDRLGKPDACEDLVETIHEIIEERMERRAELREKAEDLRRFSGAMPVDRLRGIVRTSAVNGKDVMNLSGEQVGIADDVALDPDTGKIAYVVLSRGGFLGLGEKHLAVPWSLFRVTEDRSDLVLDVSEKKLSNAPGFEWDSWPDMADTSWRAQTDTYFKNEVSTVKEPKAKTDQKK